MSLFLNPTFVYGCFPTFLYTAFIIDIHEATIYFVTDWEMRNTKPSL